jgi:hypothetical protein
MEVAPAALIEGSGVAGAVIDGEAYVFSSDGPSTRALGVNYVAPRVAKRHTVVDLAPSTDYAVSSAPEGGGCKIALTPGSGTTSSKSGVLAFVVVDCAVQTP